MALMLTSLPDRLSEMTSLGCPFESKKVLKGKKKK